MARYFAGKAQKAIDAMWDDGQIDASLLYYNNVISLKFDFYKGTRRIKFLRSNEIRTIRDCTLCRINGLEVFL